jgi:hypothetical protein
MKYYKMTVLRFQRAKFSLDYPLGAVAHKTAKLFLKINTNQSKHSRYLRNCEETTRNKFVHLWIAAEICTL